MTLEVAAQIAFVLVAVLLAWTQVGYVLALAAIARVKGGNDGTRSVTDSELPTVTILVPVYNGRHNIAAKLANSLSLDYPPDKLDVVIGSDGSTDGTAEVVRQYADSRVTLVDSQQRRGRASMTNDVIAQCDSDWVVSTDLDTRLRPDFLRRMAVHFLDPAVGVADGSINSANSGSTATARDVGFYWTVESHLKQLESKLGILASTFGNCTAVRRSVFRPMDATGDIDFITPLDAISQGYRVVHEPAARVDDIAHESIRMQIEARARMVTKNLPGTVGKIAAVGWRPGVLLSIASHKLLRWFTPVLLLVGLALSIALALSHPVYRLIVAAQVVFYGLGAVGALRLPSGRQVPLASSVLSFLAANLGFLIGILNVVRGVRMATYRPYSAPSPPGDIPV